MTPVQVTGSRQVAAGSRTYDMCSSAREGITPALTKKQVQAIAKQMISDIKNAKASETPLG